MAQVFAQKDANSDTFLDKDEIGADIVKASDSDGDGKLSCAEWDAIDWGCGGSCEEETQPAPQKETPAPKAENDDGSVDF